MNNQSYIQEIAYQLWEAEGRPEGQANKHWHEANILINTINNTTKMSSPEKSSSASERAIERQQPDQT